MCFIRWANVRNEWYWYVILGPLFPTALLAFLKLTGAAADPASGLYVTAGNCILGIILGPMQALANDLAWGRQRHDLEYYDSLPVSKLQLTLAFASVSTVFILPGMVYTLALGRWWFGFPLRPSLLVLPVMLAAALSMVGFGILAGVYARNIHHANMINNLTMLVVMFLSPVLIPYENLPRILQVTSKFLPTSYAADAFRATLAGRSDPAVWTSLGILVAFGAATLYLATRRLDWRTE